MNKKINIVSFLTMGLIGLFLSGYQNIIGIIAAEYSLSDSITGILIALYFIGSITAPLVFGAISDRKGNKIVIIVALCIVMTGLLTISLLRGVIFIAVGIFMIGSGAIVIEGTLSTLLSSVNPKEVIKAINISQVFFVLGATIGPLFTMFIINRFGNWKYVFMLFIGLYFLITIAFTSFSFGGTVEAEVERENKGLSYKLLRNRNLLILSISMLVYVGIEGGLAFWMTTFFNIAYKSQVWGAYALSGYWMGMMIGRAIGASVPNRKVSTFLRAGLFLTLVSVTSALVINNAIFGFVCFIIAGFGFATAWPVMVSITTEEFQENKGTAMGILMTSGAVGGSFVPFLIGTVGDYISIKGAFWIYPALILFIIIALQKLLSKGLVKTNISSVLEE